MNKSTLVPREEMSSLDWLARNVHMWREGKLEVLVRWPRNVDTIIWSSVLSDAGWITKEQWLTRRAELQNKPSWKDAPEWAMYMAQSPNGHWEFFAVKPRAEGWWRHPIGERSSANNASIRGAILGDWRDTLEMRPEQAEFDPFVSVEDAATAKQPEITPSKYTKTIRGVSVDVYDVLQAWGVSNPALQHLIKKALQCGRRGHKDNAQDLQDIIDSAIRAKELES